MSDWQQVTDGGKRWRVLEDGHIEVEGEGIPRTRGEPLTARTALADYGHVFRQAAEATDLPVELLIAIACIETTRVRTEDLRSRHLDASSDRWEERLQLWSAGLMHTLTREASKMNRLYEFWEDGRALDVNDLKIPIISALAGAWYLRHLAEHRTGGVDPVRLSVAYNAGSVRVPKDGASSNRWGVVTFHANRTDRFVAWYNDVVFVLAELERCV